MHTRSKAILTASIFAASVIVAPVATRAAVVVDLQNSAGDSSTQTVNVGDIIHARIFASTTSANGIAVLNARITTSLSDGGTADASPFHAVVLPTDAANVSQQPIQTTFNPALSSVSTYTLGTATAIFDASGTPTTTTFDRPVTGFNGNNGGGRGPAAFTSGLTLLADIPFKAVNPGTIFFSLSPNGPSAQEYDAATGTSATAASLSLAPGAGFTVTVLPVPEPTSIGLLSVAGALALRRRRAV